MSRGIGGVCRGASTVSRSSTRLPSRMPRSRGPAWSSSGKVTASYKPRIGMPGCTAVNGRYSTWPSDGAASGMIFVARNSYHSLSAMTLR